MARSLKVTKRSQQKHPYRAHLVMVIHFIGDSLIKSAFCADLSGFPVEGNVEWHIVFNSTKNVCEYPLRSGLHKCSSLFQKLYEVREGGEK